MRLNKKNMILQLITTIEEGIDYAKNNGGDKAKAMLNECIDGLECLSDFINEENKASETIRGIINKISSTFKLVYDNNLLESSIDLIKTMINNLTHIIINEIDTQIEVAFMPYKASMWDSFESIWREAKADPNCNTYVVPIPYYEKNEKGNCVQLYCEDNSFPKDVEVTSYKLYDFENRQPDIIYIHNPFDDYNTITMIDPRYFSNNLSKYTNMLVYVPYYVAGSYKNGEEHNTLGVLPGTINATRVIVQSKIHRELFIANGYNPNKILNLGSPKIDAMLLNPKKDVEVSSEWKDVIKDKKVILFNSTIGDVLTDTDWVKSVEDILNYFVNNESFSVIWRSHPLIDITIKTMRPEFLEGYEKLKDKISSCKNIIIDSNNDIYEAIKVSHGLITGYSSIMFQYIASEKPILSIMSNDKLEKNRFYCADYLGSYFINKGVSIYDFMEMILKGEDPKKEERMKRFKDSMTNMDGTSGEKIHQNIKNEVLALLS